MKKIISGSLVIALIFGIFACKNNKEGQFSVNGSITGADTGWVFLKKREEGKWVTSDSTQLKEGKFSFTGKLEMPEMFYLAIGDREGFMPFFIENADISVKVYADSLEKSVVTGSASHDLYKAYLDQDERFNKKMEDLYNQYMEAMQANDSVKAASLEGGFDAIEKEQIASMKDFILNNSKSVVSAYLALSNAYALELTDLQKINKALDPSLAASSYVKKLKEREEILINIQPGKVAPDFTMNDSTGKAVTLSSFKGKYVLVDFWASWCRPCRHENPTVVAAYQKYNAQGFTVLGVSLDTERDKWIEAIHIDGLTWTHVSELQGWNCSAAKLYGVMSIPSNFLIDKDGKIVESGLRGEKLGAKLAELLAGSTASK